MLRTPKWHVKSISQPTTDEYATLVLASIGAERPETPCSNVSYVGKLVSACANSGFQESSREKWYRYTKLFSRYCIHLEGSLFGHSRCWFVPPSLPLPPTPTKFSTCSLQRQRQSKDYSLVSTLPCNLQAQEFKCLPQAESGSLQSNSASHVPTQSQWQQSFVGLQVLRRDIKRGRREVGGGGGATTAVDQVFDSFTSNSFGLFAMASSLLDNNDCISSVT